MSVPLHDNVVTYLDVNEYSNLLACDELLCVMVITWLACVGVIA